MGTPVLGGPRSDAFVTLLFAEEEIFAFVSRTFSELELSFTEFVGVGVGVLIGFCIARVSDPDRIARLEKSVAINSTDIRIIDRIFESNNT
jgi:hypothetical protein